MFNNHRFPDTCRLRDNFSINHVFNSRKRLNSLFFALRYQKNDLGFSRIGVIIGKKNVRLSVTRNHIRRLIREQFRLHAIRAKGYDLVFVIYKQANAAAGQELQQCALDLLNALSTQLERS